MITGFFHNNRLLVIRENEQLLISHDYSATRNRLQLISITDYEYPTPGLTT